VLGFESAMNWSSSIHV